jgi:acetyl-CoA carboxylase biotin carboxylase subunit
VDTHITSGSHIPPYYDSLMAKIIAYAPDRAAALARLRQGLAVTRVSGVHTNLAFQERLLASAEFQAGGFDTGFITRLLERPA